jgi:type I restriction enzyme S subunit
LFSNIGQKIIKSRVTGSAQGGINRSFIKNFVVPLPPLNEQKRIVEKIEELFSKLDFIIESLNKANLQLKQYHQKFLSDLLQGKILSMISIDNDIVELITRERNNLYKKEIEINESKKKVITPKQPVVLETGYIYNCPSHWAWFTLDSIINPIRGITYGVIKLGEHTENGVPCLRTSDVKPLKIDTTNVKTISKKIADKYKRTYLQGGEVLVNVRGTLGGVCTVPTDFAGYNISREIALVPILSVIPKKWIMYWISSAAVQNWLTKSSKGITYRGINLEDLRNLPICLPPLKEINRLVNEIEKHFSRINHTTQQLNNFENINKLKSKILKLAFEGKLIPQDPNDEPAEILLQKIKQEKQKIISQTSERKKHAR